MPTVDFGACLSIYWFVWTMNGIGSILGLVVNMAVSYFILKLLTKAANISPPPSNNTGTDFSQFRNNSPMGNMPIPLWTNDPTMGNMPIPLWTNDPTMGNMPIPLWGNDPTMGSMPIPLWANDPTMGNAFYTSSV